MNLKIIVEGDRKEGTLGTTKEVRQEYGLGVLR